MSAAKKVKSVQNKKVDMYQKYQDVFGNVKGQEVLEDMMRRFGIMSTTAILTSAGQMDPLQMAFLEGQRAVVLEILKTLKLEIPKLREQLTQPVRDNF